LANLLDQIDLNTHNVNYDNSFGRTKNETDNLQSDGTAARLAMWAQAANSYGHLYGS